MSLVRMHPADAAASANAGSKFAHRDNAGFADATCNVTTGRCFLWTGAYSSRRIAVRTALSTLPAYLSGARFRKRSGPVSLVLSDLSRLAAIRGTDSLTNISCAEGPIPDQSSPPRNERRHVIGRHRDLAETPRMVPCTFAPMKTGLAAAGSSDYTVPALSTPGRNGNHRWVRDA